MKKRKRNDILLIILLLIAAGLFFLAQRNSGRSGNQAVVTIDGEAYGSYTLAKEQIISINGHNTLQIQDGSASITEADCPDKLCVRQGRISRVGESIICLPNQVVITIIGEEGPEIDAVVH